MNGFQSMNAVFILLLATICAQGEDDVDKRHESNKAAGLFAFPRVGRAGGGGHLVWKTTSEKGTAKRGSFGNSPGGRLRTLQRFLAAPESMGFGDVAGAGRRDAVAETPRKTGGVTSTLWFGPRLGRRQKRDADAEADADAESLAIPWTLIFKEYPKLKNRGGFTPRLGRDSQEEDYENFEIGSDDDDKSSRDHGRRIRSGTSMNDG